MRHRVSGKQLSRTTSHRLAMRRNMASSLFEHGTIRTTVAKAKELRPFVERLITMAKKNTLHARRLVIKELNDRRIAAVDENKQVLTDKYGLAKLQKVEGTNVNLTVVKKLFDEIAPKYVDRPGGYTRIIPIAERRIGDSGKQVIMQLVGEDDAPEKRKTTKRSQRLAKLQEFAGTAEAAPAEEVVAEEPAEEVVEDPAAEEVAEEATEEKAE
ncbi:MAG: 50S ribosomal protein L17 [Phycisphaerales bacterium]|jgi:large subunit ribosomal protein L17|nr:50S ribosomal protein L17 [Phycisphaerales bacterium]MBT7171581.1 50S ribosomal protein L17 [Phycisphaerales bacterium]